MVRIFCTSESEHALSIYSKTNGVKKSAILLFAESFKPLHVQVITFDDKPTVYRGTSLIRNSRDKRQAFLKGKAF